MGKFKDAQITTDDSHNESQLSQLNFVGLIDLIKNFSSSNEPTEILNFQETENIEVVSEDQMAFGLCL